jgi:hypothetical protein
VYAGPGSARAVWQGGGVASSLVQRVRGRVRLRTRLRATRERWHRIVPRRLPRWSGPSGAEPAPAPHEPTAAPDAVADAAPDTLAVATGGRVSADATTANPLGRQRYGRHLPTGLLRLVPGTGGAWWQIGRGAAQNARFVVVVAGRVGDPLDEPQAAVLRELGAVHLDGGWAGAVPPAAAATAIVQLAMTGVVLHGRQLPDGVAPLLAPELADLVLTPLPGRDADPLEWEIRSIRQRRAALRHHAAGLAPPAGAGTAGRPPAVTAVLLTRRPHLLSTVVRELAGQTYPELEIVVGLHGVDLPAAARDELTTQRRRVHLVRIPPSRNFGEALGEATRRAGGSLITKVDDDDRYGPEHIWDLVLARHYSRAAVVGKGAEFVHVQPKDVTVRRRMGAELFTDVVAGGTILLAREDLAAVGGWSPVDRSVDRDLLDRVLGAGGRVYRTHGLGFIYTRHGAGHTWEADLDYFLRDPLRRWRGLPRHEEFGTS